MIYDIRPLQDQVSSTLTNFVSVYGGIEAFGGGKTEYTERRLNEGGGGEEIARAFFSKSIVGGKHILQGGQVATFETPVANIELATVGSEPANGTPLWLKITGDGNVIEGILYGGFTVTSVTNVSTTSPVNTSPTAALSTGRNFHVLLGMWQDDVFQPSVAGHISVDFCPGSGYVISRF